MKKLVLMFAAVAAISFASCDNKKAAEAEAPVDSVAVDSVDSLAADSVDSVAVDSVATDSVAE
ncbi:MAG: hypothetical protein HUK06_04005 [Bacteroidaceae bacterium]|nr:hypothetical protein [Bacteroidaceae bacterium]